MIVVSPSNGAGETSETGGAAVVLFTSEYADDPTTLKSNFAIRSTGSATGQYVLTSGQLSWTWLQTGAANDYEVYCQPTSGSVTNGSASVNHWIGLNSTRTWVRKTTPVVLAITIRDAATQTTQATCTITLTS